MVRKENRKSYKETLTAYWMSNVRRSNVGPMGSPEAGAGTNTGGRGAVSSRAGAAGGVK